MIKSQAPNLELFIRLIFSGIDAVWFCVSSVCIYLFARTLLDSSPINFSILLSCSLFSWYFKFITLSVFILVYWGSSTYYPIFSIAVAYGWWIRGVFIRIGICIEWGVKGVWSAYWRFSTSCWLYLVWPWWGMGCTCLSSTKTHHQVIHMMIKWCHLAARCWWRCLCQEASLSICLKLGKIVHVCLFFNIKLLYDVLCRPCSWVSIIPLSIDLESIKCLLYLWWL